MEAKAFAIFLVVLSLTHISESRSQFEGFLYGPTFNPSYRSYRALVDSGDPGFRTINGVLSQPTFEFGKIIWMKVSAE